MLNMLNMLKILSIYTFHRLNVKDPGRGGGGLMNKEAAAHPSFLFDDSFRLLLNANFPSRFFLMRRSNDAEKFLLMEQLMPSCSFHLAFNGNTNAASVAIVAKLATRIWFRNYRK